MSVTQLSLRNGQSRTEEDTTRSEVYLVQLTAPPSSLSLVENTSGYFPGKVHPTNSTLVVGTVSVEPLSNTQFEVTVDYIPVNKSTSFTGNGLNRDQVSVSRWFDEEVVERSSINGSQFGEDNAFTSTSFNNSAGSPPQNYPTQKIAYPQVVVRKRVRNLDMSTLSQIGKVNNNEFTLVGIKVPRFCAMLADFQPEVFYDDKGYPYYVITYTMNLKFKKSIGGKELGFVSEILDAGYQFLSNDPEVKLGLFMLDDGTPPTEPIRLNGEGRGAAKDNPDDRYYYYRLIPEVVTMNYGLPEVFPK